MSIGCAMIARTVMLSALGGWLAAASAQDPQERNPSYFRAAELLGRADSGGAPRVRFEWERVPGARLYVLSGQWTDGQSWAVRSAEHRVDAQTATSWEHDRVTFDVSLPSGAHSWTIVALFGQEERGDFTSPAHFSFTLR
jgi:hypothetical protein